MPTAILPKSSTPLSTTSSVATNNTTTAVQSGPYTKAQFQSTMEGSRSVKNAKEIEQLLRDYPAALELYRTGRYKVKVKYEADVERVILVEKRNTKGTTNPNPGSTGTDVSEKNSSLVDISNVSTEKVQPEVKAERESIQSRSRTQSRDRLAPALPPVPAPAPAAMPTSNGNGAPNVVHTTTSSMRMSSNAQPKVDHHRTPSKDREASVVSQSKQMPVQQGIVQKQPSHRRSQSRESTSVASHVKQQQQQHHHHQHQGRKSHRDYAKMVVPYVQNANPMANMWNQQRAVQPYYSNPMLNQQRTSMYVPSTVVASQNALYRPPYPYAQQNSSALTYQKPTAYGPTSMIPSYGNLTNNSNKIPSNYDGSIRSIVSSTQAPPLPPSFQTIHANRQPYPVPPVQHPSMYSSQMQYPMGMQMMWPGMPNYSMVPPMINPQANVYNEHRRSSKHRARSVDTGPRAFPQAPAQGQPGTAAAAAPAVEHYHHHRHHHRHHRPSVNVHPQDVPVVPVEATVTTSAVLKDAVPTVAPPPPLPPQPAPQPAPPSVLAPPILVQPVVPAAPVSNGEKLTIRQLNEMFVQTDPSGRLSYGSIPPILQRFGIGLNENDLSSAAQELQYNVNDPISARRLVHVLVKLGKIAKSNHQPAQQQQRTAPSPSMLPEDREVTDILTQRQAVSNTMYPSVYPTHWQ